MNVIIDFTKFRKGHVVNGHEIVYCKCGGKGQRIEGRFVHRIETWTFLGLEIVKRTQCGGKANETKKPQEGHESVPGAFRKPHG